MPEKLTIYSTLVGWLNAQSDSFGADFMKYVMSEMNDMIVDARWEAVRYMFRFICGKSIFIDHGVKTIIV